MELIERQLIQGMICRRNFGTSGKSHEHNISTVSDIHYLTTHDVIGSILCPLRGSPCVI